MPTKTDRILSYLPQTFRTSRPPGVLHALVDGFGNELLLGENSLAAIMLAHWVDFADKNESEINDLQKIAALYGLVPWRDESGATLESVEEFREHLKRYVRTYLEGTVTVQGILRVTAENLGLRILDAPEQLDRWWARTQDSVVTIDALGNDAAAQLNFNQLVAIGNSVLPAQVTGTVNLSEPVKLGQTNTLRLKVDGTYEEIDLTKDLEPSAALSLQDIVDIINHPPRPSIASAQGPYLKLASPQIGSGSKLEVINGPNDAAARLLGLTPRTYHGTAETAAQYKGTPDLSKPTDLSNERYLRIEIDGNLVEIDCADASDASHTTLDHIRDRINNAFPGLNVASHDDKHLILTSPTKGLGSKISVQPPAAQNAANKLFGVPAFFVAGLAAQSARADSPRDLRGRIDLSERGNIRVRIDGAPPVLINCAGVEPDKTERVEIVAAINDALNAPLASVTERSISLSSPTTGSASEIAFEKPEGGDATFEIFGISPSTFQGSAANPARLTATPSLTGEGLDVRADNFLLMAVDGGAPVDIDLSEAAADHDELLNLPLSKVADHINTTFGGAEVASTDGERLFLTSTRKGSVSKLQILPREITRKRRFVTRATVTDEAALEVFGFVSKEAQGKSPVAARLEGKPDLSQSVDLTKTAFLRLRVDGHAPVEIDCAGPRARATTLPEVVSKINDALKPLKLTEEVATNDGKHLILVSPAPGSESRLAIEPPRLALDKLMKIEPGTFHGADATSVKFTGTVDLTAGIDLPAEATIKLGVDGEAASEIVLGAAAPIHRSAFEIVNAINTKLQAPVAATDGRRIELQSAKKGSESRISFEVPAAQDVTKQVFGIAGPRDYRGAAATPAQVVGIRDLSGTTDLTVFRFLKIGFDGAPAQIFDCAAKAAKHEAATLAEIVESIGPDIASATSDDKNLVLRSPGTGATARITLEPFNEKDASKALFGDSPLDSSGIAASPAVITGTKSLLGPVNLSRRNALRIAVDGERPVDIDVAAEKPAQTLAEVIVNSINRVFPNLAAINADDRLELTSPTAGPGSYLSLQPLRFIEVIEYPFRKAEPLEVVVKHSGFWTVVNDGVADGFAEINIYAPQGTVGPSVFNSGTGWLVHLFVVLERGETARLFRDKSGAFKGEIIDAGGETRCISPSRILVGPLGPQAHVPFKATWSISGERTLQLNNPQAPRVLVLQGRDEANEVSVDVIESDISGVSSQPIEADGGTHTLAGRLKTYNEAFQLVDDGGTVMAELLEGPNTNLRGYLDQVVKVEGALSAGTPPLMLVEKIASLFDVFLCSYRKGSTTVNEPYLGVTIGAGIEDDASLAKRINQGDESVAASKLVTARELDKASILSVTSGNTVFRYLDCRGSRFDAAHFDYSRFPDGVCRERGVFDVSRFSNAPPERIKTVFAADPPIPDPPVKVTFRLEKFAAGSFVVNLPADLPPQFGGRFDDARFGQEKTEPELYEGAVAEPKSDPKFLVKLISPPSGDVSNFVTATHVDTRELGWIDQPMPFRTPKFLTLGGPDRAARLYLSEPGLDGFIRLDAQEKGAWGNEIAVSARLVGPAIYDVSIYYRGGRFEQARSIVLGVARKPGAEFKPGPTGVLQAKAAGVRVDVTRERADHGS